MIQVTNVVDALFGLVGWRNDMSDSGLNISAELTQSLTGLYFNDAHPLLTLKNLRCIAPNFEQMEGVADPNTTFCDWLKQKTRTSIANAINHFVFSVMPSGGSKTLLEHRLLFNSVGRIGDTVPNKGNLVGLEIHPLHNFDAAVKIEKVGLQAIGDSTMMFTLHMLSSNDMFSIRRFVLEDVGSYKTGWMSALSTEAPLSINNLDGGQCLYLFYDQNQLANNDYKAVNRTIDWSKAPCKTCHSADYEAYMAWSKYLEITPFYVARENVIPLEDGAAWDATFDQQNMVYTNNTNYGLNMELSIYCDYTNFLIRNRYEFVQLIMAQLAVDMLKEFAYNANVRANRNSVNVSRTDVLFALDGNQDSLGLVAKLENMYKGLNVSMKGLDKVCRPCCNKGIRFTVT